MMRERGQGVEEGGQKCVLDVFVGAKLNAGCHAEEDHAGHDSSGEASPAFGGLDLSESIHHAIIIHARVGLSLKSRLGDVQGVCQASSHSASARIACEPMVGESQYLDPGQGMK